MTGWIYSILIIAALGGAAAALQWRLARRWFDHLCIATLALVLLKPVAAVTGDISAILPDVWSDDASGKHQIILASAVATLAVAIIAASLLNWLGQRATEYLLAPKQG